MRQCVHTLFNAFQLVEYKVYKNLTTFFTKLLFQLAGVQCSTVNASGIPFVHISRHAQMSVGRNFTLGSSIKTAATGMKGRCRIEVRNRATLRIGHNVGMTLTTIECFDSITIGNDVMIGFGVHIMDTDFHSIDPGIRLSGCDKARTAPVVIADKVFIGAQALIMKGVTIGEGAVVGAGSVVTKNVPPYSVVAGNPATVIKKLK